MEQFTTYFFTQGILGVLAIGEFIIIFFLYRENKVLNKDALESIKEVQTNTTVPLQKLQETSDRLIGKMEQNNEILLKFLSKSE